MGSVKQLHSGEASYVGRGGVWSKIMAAFARTACIVLIVVCVLPLIAVILIPYGLWQLITGLLLRAWFYVAHVRRGRRVMLVYSDSPNWQAYIEANILPRLADRAVVLNWSRRRMWRREMPLAAAFFRHFAGSRDFNPMAIVMDRGRFRRVRFYRAFLDFKHGKDRRLRAAEQELFDLIDAPEGSAPSRAEAVIAGE